MARPLRLEFEGAIYHLLGRGNARQRIFASERDRIEFLKLLRKKKGVSSGKEETGQMFSLSQVSFSAELFA
jgi:hypothetical protein